jgi:hypothetical protein
MWGISPATRKAGGIRKICGTYLSQRDDQWSRLEARRCFKGSNLDRIDLTAGVHVYSMSVG